MVVATVVVAVPMAPVRSMFVTAMTAVFPVMMPVPVTMFISLPITVSVTIVTSMAVIAVIPAMLRLLLVFTAILLVVAASIPVAVPGVHGHRRTRQPENQQTYQG